MKNNILSGVPTINSISGGTSIPLHTFSAGKNMESPMRNQSKDEFRNIINSDIRTS